jgi:hypothetical protein
MERINRRELVRGTVATAVTLGAPAVRAQKNQQTLPSHTIKCRGRSAAGQKQPLSRVCFMSALPA